MNTATAPLPDLGECAPDLFKVPADEQPAPPEDLRTTALRELSTVDAGIAALTEKYGSAVYAVTTTAGMKEATQARMAIREARFKTEHIRKAKQSELKKIGADINQEAARITGALLLLETPIDEQIKAEEARREQEKAAKEQAERERIAAIQADIAAITNTPLALVDASHEDIGAAIDRLEAIPITLDVFGDFGGQAEQARRAAIITLDTMHTQALAREAEAARQAEEAERLRIEREALERQRAEQAERERLAEEGRKAAQARIDADFTAQQESLRKAREAQEAELARLKAEQEAEIQRQRDEIAAQQAAIAREKAEAERIELERLEEAARIEREAKEAADRLVAEQEAERQRLAAEEAQAETARQAEAVAREVAEARAHFIAEGPTPHQIVELLCERWDVDYRTAVRWLAGKDFSVVLIDNKLAD